MPHDADGAGPVVGERFDPERPPAHPEGANRAEADEERGRLAPDEIRHRGKVPPVLVTEGQGQEQIRDRREARDAESLGEGRAHSRIFETDLEAPSRRPRGARKGRRAPP